MSYLKENSRKPTETQKGHKQIVPPIPQICTQY